MKPVGARTMSWTLPMRQMSPKAVCPCLTSPPQMMRIPANTKHVWLPAKVTPTSWRGRKNSSVKGWRAYKSRTAWWTTILTVGRRSPKILTPLAPPISYMKEHGVFKPLQSTTNPLGLCHFYCVDPANVSTLPPLKQPATSEHVKSLLFLTNMLRRPYIIVVFQGGTVTPLGLLQELHTWSALARIPIYWSEETKDGHKPCVSCCPFCTYTVQNDLAYLNHIVCAHYNANFACGTCLSAVTSSGQQMKKHIKECSGLAFLPTASQESVCSGHSPK